MQSITPTAVTVGARRPRPPLSTLMVESPIIASPPMPPRNPESRFASPIDHTTDGVCAGVLTNEVTTSVVIKPCTTPAMARRRPLPTTCAGARVRALVGGRGRQGGQSGRQAYLYAHARVWVWVWVGEGGVWQGVTAPRVKMVKLQPRTWPASLELMVYVPFTL